MIPASRVLVGASGSYPSMSVDPELLGSNQSSALVDALFTEKSMSFTQFDEEQMLALIKN